MALRVYNSLSRKKELFEPIEADRVRMYVCGPTVYDSCHIGHARSVVVFDVIVRYLRAIGYDTTYVRNFTDVDDKIINRANELDMDPQLLADKYIQEFYDDMDALNVERATVEPKATDHIPQIIAVIEELFQRGLAYRAGDDVFFHVGDYAAYGKLSGRKIEDMEAGARVDIDDKKQNPHDFVLWKAAKPGEPVWDSPWGRGRPGWHIECSAMSTEYLGHTIDIHGGGKDLIFPHHENEIAQSEGASGKPFVKYWIHNGFVNINHEKMSKSLGNFLIIKDVIKAFHPEAIRLFLLSNHYRSPIDFTEQVMIEASGGLDKNYAFLERAGSATTSRIDKEEDRWGEMASGDTLKAFSEAMDDDFNTAKGIGVLFDAIRKGNRLLDSADDELSEETYRSVQSIRTDLLKAGQILGILYEDPAIYFDTKRSQSLHQESIDPSLVEKLIADRENARVERQWDRADEIRAELDAMNIILEDRPEGTIWKSK